MNDSRNRETLRKSYLYLRSAMILLVICLAVSIAIQTFIQGSLLGSVSAYYFTPSNAIFVGALIAIGVCLISLKGEFETDDVLLNVAGMLAPVVALVPTSRGDDYEDARRACVDTGGFTENVPTDVDCPKVLELRAITEDSVENNIWALLVVGLLGLIATAFFAAKDSDKRDQFESSAFVWGFGLAGVLYLGGAATFILKRQFFIDNAHFPAAVGVFGCVVGVALFNAVRHSTKFADPPRFRGIANAIGLAWRALRSRDRYSNIALAMLLVVAIGVPVHYLADFKTTIFWIEALLILLFGFFWVVQTAEKWKIGAGEARDASDLGRGGARTG